MEYRRIYAKIDLDALEHNFSQIRSKLHENVELMPIIKADAYGHGSVEIAKFLEGKCSRFGVATVEEAVELRHAGITAPLLLLGYTSPMEYRISLKHNVSITIFNLDEAKLLSKTAAEMGKTAVVHIAVDTGMSRIGFGVSEKAADKAAEIFSLEGIRVEGIFSHFATADEADKTFAHRQKEQFDKFVSMLDERGCKAEIYHLSNSAGIMELDGVQYNMVRAGIILYGHYPSEDVAKEELPLRPVMELVTHVSHVKTVPEGCGISYGHTFITDKKTRVATIPVGYADGYPRALSNKGRVIIHGTSCPILGRICMDQMMVDVSDVPDVCVGDEVTLVGTDGGETITVEELSEGASSFNYEFVCNIGRRIPRAYFRNGEHVKTVSYLVY